MGSYYHAPLNAWFKLVSNESNSGEPCCMYNQTAQARIHDSAGYCQIAEHPHILKVSDLLSYITYYLQLWPQFFLHSSHSSSPLHLPSCNELKRHTLCRVWALEHWTKFLVKPYLQEEPINGRKIWEALITNCKAEFCATTAPIQEGSLQLTHPVQTTVFLTYSQKLQFLTMVL